MIFLCLIVISAQAFSQSAPLSTKQIKQIAFSIDTGSGLKQSAVTGRISNRGREDGMFTDVYYTNTRTGKLVKVLHCVALDYYDIQTYYYDNDQLILTRTVRKNIGDETDQVLATGDYYFQNNQLMHKEEMDQDIRNTQAYVQTAGLFKSRISK